LLFLSLLFIVLSIGTLGWNPLRPPFRALAGGGRAIGESLSRGAERRKERRRRRVEARRAKAAEAAAARERRAGTDDDAGTGGGVRARGAGDAAAGMDPSSLDADSGVATAPIDGAPARDGSAPGEDATGSGGGGAKSPSWAAAGRTLKWGRKGDADDGVFPDPTDPRDLAGGDLPALDLLTVPERRDRTGMDRELDALGDVLVEKLNTFNVKSSIGGRTTGPVVTQFEVVPAPGVKVNRIANLDADLALAMRAQTIRIVAPIPGKGAVGVEIPNPKPEMVHLHSILASRAYRASRAELPLALGEDLRGNAYVADLTKMPHVLIAGATGAGKSVCLNTVITSLVYRHTPETLRLLLIDPKMVELSTYGDLPHLRHPVVTDPKEAAGVLKWAVLEMERRYTLLSENGVRSLAEFNRRVREGVTMRRAYAKGDEGDPDRWIYDDGILPFIVLVLDELADLMMTVQGEVEKPLTHLAQKARAIGIHLIVATQRPSVNVITGLIKANFPCRIAFRVASKVDSRTILDQNGADALLGNGDMLFLPPGQSEPVRVQGAYIGTDDTNSVMEWFRERARARIAELEEGEALPPAKEEDILDQVRSHEAQEATDAAFGEDGFGDWDDLFQAAAEVCIQQDQGSTSLLQRKLRIGYGRAARIVDQLHDAGVLGPPDGSKPREVLMSMGEIEAMFNPGRGGSGEGTEQSRIG
ncbi:MAG: DNA translocase FtsK, partial [Gemmatimonadota bacterium]